MESDKLLGRIGPAREDDVADDELLGLLRLAHLVVVGVDEELGQVEELRYELLHIGRVPLAVAPRRRHRSEQPVGVIEFAALEAQPQRRVRFLHCTNKQGNRQVVPSIRKAIMSEGKQWAASLCAAASWGWRQMWSNAFRSGMSVCSRAPSSSSAPQSTASEMDSTLRSATFPPKQPTNQPNKQTNKQTNQSVVNINFWPGCGSNRKREREKDRQRGFKLKIYLGQVPVVAG